MHIRLIAVGDRQPPWVEAAVDSYVTRLPQHWRFRLEPITTARRRRSGSAADAVASEGERILSKLGRDEQVVLLDERGTQIDTAGFATRLASWQSDGRDLAFVIGGPDGVSTDCRRRADFVWSLSALTLPHGLARVLLVEQLYRGWSLAAGHPYHRA